MRNEKDCCRRRCQAASASFRPGLSTFNISRNPSTGDGKNMTPKRLTTASNVSGECGRRSAEATPTQETYEGYLKKWVVPKWGAYRLAEIKVVQVEQWLKTLFLARGS